MKKTILLLLLCVMMCGSGHSQLLWKVSGGNTYKPSYLFGTIHLETSQFIDSVPGLTDALTATDVVYGEVLSDSLVSGNSMMAMMKGLVAPADSTIDLLLTADEYRMVDAVVRDYLMGIIGLDQLKKYKPVVVSTQLEVLQAQKYFPDFNNLTDGIDIALQQRAAAMGKYVGGLESVSDQMAALFGAPLTEQARDLVDMCRKDEDFKEYNNMMVSAYRLQDFNELEAVVMNPEMGADDDDMERLAYARNRRWMEKLQATMPVQSMLVVVGSAHLMGEQGLIALLRKSGYTVEPVSPRRPNSEHVFVSPDAEAQFPGGDAALEEHIARNVYIPDSITSPITSLGGKIYARCIVGCVIEADGTVTSPEIEKTTSAQLFDNEALRVVSTLPPFIPAQVAGTPVRSRAMIPVVFNYGPPQ